MSKSWQLLTRFLGLRMSFRFDMRFDPVVLVRELENLREAHPPVAKGKTKQAPKWTAISLRSIGGDVAEERDRRRFANSAPYADTPALDHAPYMREILNRIPGPKDRVRLLGLAPDGDIDWHTDGHGACISFGQLARLHVPIITDPGVEFEISHEKQHWAAGELWYGDFGFPHRLTNKSNTLRYHLVIDVQVTPELEAMMGPFKRTHERKRIRQFALIAASRMLHRSHQHRRTSAHEARNP